MIKKLIVLSLIALLVISSFGMCTTINSSDKPNAIHGEAHFNSCGIITDWTQWMFRQLNYNGNGEEIASNTWSQGGGWTELKPESSTIDFQYRILTQWFCPPIYAITPHWCFKVKMLHYTGGRIFVHTDVSFCGDCSYYQIEYNGKMGYRHRNLDPNVWEIVDLQGNY